MLSPDAKAIRQQDDKPTEGAISSQLLTFSAFSALGLSAEPYVLTCGGKNLVYEFNRKRYTVRST
jgi:hypothetical protein